MMLPVVRVLVERAANARHRLLGLVEVLPEEMLERRETADGWSVRVHLAHALSTDGLLVQLLEREGADQFAAWLASLEVSRTTAISAAAQTPVSALLQHAADDRSRLLTAMEALRPVDLDAGAAVPGVRTAWGDPRRITLYEYLQAWSGHDGDHEQAIRRAILSRPDLSAVALTQRRVRR